MKNNVQYDQNNVFAKVLRSELPSNKVYEDEHVLAFYDINPSKPVHILLIPKSDHITFHDFVDNENDIILTHFFRVARQLIKNFNISDRYQLIMNTGPGYQEVPHFHLHIAGHVNSPSE